MNIEHITPEEAMRLYCVLSLDGIRAIKPFVEVYAATNPEDQRPHRQADRACLALMAFNAGRVEGVRAERARRAKGRSGTLAAINNVLSRMGERELEPVYTFARGLTGPARKEDEYG